MQSIGAIDSSVCATLTEKVELSSPAAKSDLFSDTSGVIGVKKEVEAISSSIFSLGLWVASSLLN